MRRSNLFWGGILILLGILFSLQAANIIDDVFGWFWPLFLILLGIAVLVSRFTTPNPANGESFSISLENAAKVALNIDLGASSVKVMGGAPRGTAVSGTQGTTINFKSRLNGDTLTVDIDAGPSFLPFLGPEGGSWVFQLTNEVPVSMKLDGGAASLDFDFTDIKLDFLGVEMGASSMTLKLPANAGRTLIDVEAGAASMDIIIPQGVAARIRIEQGASAQNIDLARFPEITSGLYQSPDFENAENKAEINLEGGANSITIR